MTTLFFVWQGNETPIKSILTHAHHNGYKQKHWTYHSCNIFTIKRNKFHHFATPQLFCCLPLLFVDMLISVQFFNVILYDFQYVFYLTFLALTWSTPANIEKKELYIMAEKEIEIFFWCKVIRKKKWKKS